MPKSAPLKMHQPLGMNLNKGLTMDNATYTIENWLSVFDGAQDKGLEVWDPGFDGDRCLVVAKFGPFARKFARPPAFVATFWHRIYPLPIENWQISFDTPLYGGFCTLTTHLHILFQPTIEFAKRTLEAARAARSPAPSRRPRPHWASA